MSSAQSLRRRKRTTSVLKNIHCASKSDGIKPVLDGMWATLVASTTKDELQQYIEHSAVCTSHVIPNIVKKKVKDYETSKENEVRSIRELYEGGILSKKEYSTKRNCSDVTKDADDNSKSEFVKGCQVPKVISYKKLMKYINSINIGEVESLDSLPGYAGPSANGVYRPLKSFLLLLADLYLSVHRKQSCLHWFNGKENTFYIAVGADGAPFGKDNTATGRFSSIKYVQLIQK